MTIVETFKLSFREIKAHKTRSVAAIITVGILLVLIFSMLLVLQGVEDAITQYTKSNTGGGVFLLTEYEGNDKTLVHKRAEKYHGEIIELTDEQIQISGYNLSNVDVIMKFDDLKNACEYYDKLDEEELHYSYGDYQIIELFGNQIGAYKYLQEIKNALIYPASIVLVIISASIFLFTMAHIISSNAMTFALYRSIGATRKQILAIYFIYIMELCFCAVLFAILVAFVITVIINARGQDYFAKWLAKYYTNLPRVGIVPVGINLGCLKIAVCMFLASALAFLLCLDRFSDKRIAQKLREN